MRSASLIDKAAALPPPEIQSLNKSLFLQLFEEDRAAAMQSEEAAAEFLGKATDVEALLVMSEVSLAAPLNDIGYKMMMHLSNKVFTRAGIQNIPDFIQQAASLDSYHEDHLNRFKQDIRAKQGRLTKKEKRHVEL